MVWLRVLLAGVDASGGWLRGVDVGWMWEDFGRDAGWGGVFLKGGRGAGKCWRYERDEQDGVGGREGG